MKILLLRKNMFMKKIYFAIYNLATDSIEIYVRKKLKIIFNCTTQLNNNVSFDDPWDIAYAL